MRYRRVAVEGASYFFTVVTYRRQPIFKDIEVVRVFELAEQSVQARRPFICEAQVLLADHLHALWTLPEGDADYANRWRLIKTAFTQEYARSHFLPVLSASRKAKGEQAVWQRRYWEHLIRDDRDFDAHLDYIHFNPVRHGLAASPCDWPHSTFQDWVARGRYELTWGSDKAPELPAWAGRE